MSSRAFMYHPIRWRLLRSEPDTSEMYADYSDYREDIHEKKITEEQAAVEMGETYYGDPALSFGDIMDIVADQEEIWKDVESFEESGSNIFHLRPALVELFKHSSASEIPINIVKMPFESLFLYWGEAAGIKTPDGDTAVDGAYIETVPDVYGVHITMTTQIANVQEVMKAPLLNRLNLDKHRLNGIYSDNPITIGEMYQERFKSPWLHCSEEEYNSDMQRMKTQMEEAGVLNSDYEEKFAKTYHEEITEFKPLQENVLWREQDMMALNLIFNFLCYLSYERRDIAYRYPKEAPDKLIVKAENTRKPTESRRAQSKLESLGFRKVYVCGDNIQRRFKDSSQGTTTTTHWRRGHWRNQACGERRTQHKLIWIEPTIVKPGQGEPPGHIYIH